MSVAQKIKQKLAALRFKRQGVNFEAGARFDRSVDVQNAQNATIGKASILYKNISLYIGAKGSFQIGAHSHIAPFGYLLIDKNNITMGDHVAIGPFCTFVCHSNHFEGDNEMFSKNYLDGDITIGNNVFMGAQCTVLPGTIIENNVVVASNSVVKGILEANSVYGGSPAKKIKSLKNGE